MTFTISNISSCYFASSLQHCQSDYCNAHDVKTQDDTGLVDSTDLWCWLTSPHLFTKQLWHTACLVECSCAPRIRHVQSVQPAHIQTSKCNAARHLQF